MFRRIHGLCRVVAKVQDHLLQLEEDSPDTRILGECLSE